MNRPTRAPAPSPTGTVVLDHDDGPSFVTEEATPHNLPAARSQQSNATAPQPEPEREPVTLPKTGFAQLAAAIAGVMAEIKPVEKSGWNDFHKYTYARMQDLSAELTPLMGKHGIVVFQNELTRDMFDDGRAMAVRYEFTIVHRSGEIWPDRPIITGVSMCRTSNGKYDDKAFNKCHTSARKYFLLSLFQIPTDDSEDADAGGSDDEPRPRPRPQAKRPAPAPNGKMPPHLIAIVDGENPQEWGTRFKGFIEKSETTEEIDRWYNANMSVFDKLKGRFQGVYDDLIDAMDGKAARLTLPKASERADPISSGKPSNDGLDIPPALRRTAQPAELSPYDREWLIGLDGAFSGCEDVESINDEYKRLMEPFKTKVSATAWNKAIDLRDQNILRINEAE